MLFIVFGATLDMGYEIRNIFSDRGFEIVRKYNYVDSDSDIDPQNYIMPQGDYVNWFNDKKYVTRDEFEALDFTYELDGVHIGINQQDIIDAVRGVNNAVLTIGASALDFVLKLKIAYGDYITLINVFEDIATVETSASGIDQGEREKRISANRNMQRLYLDNILSFDGTVIYTGENSVYDKAALGRQTDILISKRKVIEKHLNNSKYVELPYNGCESYIFVSYSHKDFQRVGRIFSQLQSKGFRLWYDDGIKGGEAWRKIIANKIKEARMFLLFCSENAIVSDEIKAEINAAFLCKKDYCIVQLDDASFDLEYEMYFSGSNKLSIGIPDFIDRLESSLPLETRNG